MATSTNCTKNCGCTDTYVATQPCPPSCPEVFQSQCIVYTGTDILCNKDTVIKRYDYLDTVITKLVNYICSVEAPISTVAGSEYIDVVSNTIGNVTTYTVYVDVPALQAYFDLIIAQAISASFVEGPGIDISVNPITSVVTVSHQDTSSVSNLNSDNTGNSFIQDIFFTFDTFGHVTGASVVPGTVTPPNDFDRAQINPDSGFTWGPDNDPTNIQIADAPGDTLNFVAGVGIALNASTVAGTDAIRITNTAPAVPVVLTSAGGTETLVNDGTGPSLATKGLTASANSIGEGIRLSSSATEVTIGTTFNKFTQSSSVLMTDSVTVTHNLTTAGLFVSVLEFDGGIPTANAYVHGTDYTYNIVDTNTIEITNISSIDWAPALITVFG